MPEAPRKQLTWIDLEPTKKVIKSNDKRRIVQTAEGRKEKEAPADAHLGWQNQTVDRQTVSKNKTTIMGSAPKENAGKTAKKTLSQLGLAILPAASRVYEDKPQWATPGTRPQDSLDGIAESDRTALNTQEFKFYGYFQRIRERLDRAWVPILKEKLMVYYRSGRQLASDSEHVTKVVVFLNEAGEIVRVQLLSESGTRDLDEAAVSAFNKAGPFPNPPKGMADGNHEIQIPWDFILKT
jgi:TonB family protein